MSLRRTPHAGRADASSLNGASSRTRRLGNWWVLQSCQGRAPRRPAQPCCLLGDEGERGGARSQCRGILCLRAEPPPRPLRTRRRHRSAARNSAPSTPRTSLEFAARISNTTAREVVARLVAEASMPEPAPPTGVDSQSPRGLAVYADYDGHRTDASYDRDTTRIDVTSRTAGRSELPRRRLMLREQWWRTTSRASAPTATGDRSGRSMTDRVDCSSPSAAHDYDRD